MDATHADHAALRSHDRTIVGIPGCCQPSANVYNRPIGNMSGHKAVATSLFGLLHQL